MLKNYFFFIKSYISLKIELKNEFVENDSFSTLGKNVPSNSHFEKFLSLVFMKQFHETIMMKFT